MICTLVVVPCFFFVSVCVRGCEDLVNACCYAVCELDFKASQNAETAWQNVLVDHFLNVGPGKLRCNLLSLQAVVLTLSRGLDVVIHT
jgi:hypothetical protein